MQVGTRVGRWIALATVIAFTSISASAAAAPGDPDTTFSGDGISSVGFGDTIINGFDEGRDAVAAPGGGYFVTGTSAAQSFVAKYTSTGGLDPAFGGGDGLAFTDEQVSANALTLDASGQPVIAGIFSGGPSQEFFVARFTAAGAADTSFAGDGTTTFGFGEDSAGATAVALLPDGRIAVSGSYNSEDFAVALLTSAGALDNTFGPGGDEGDGRVLTDFGTGTSERSESIVITAGPRINVAGGTFNPAPSDGGDFAVARYEPDGDLDGAFSGDGKQTVDVTGPVDGNPDFANAIAEDGSGNLVLGGQAGFSPNPPSPCVNSSLGAARLTPAGAPDMTFAGDGSGTYDFPAANCLAERALALDLQADGKIVLGGSIDNALPSNQNFIAARVGTNGVLDTTFDGDGYAQVDFGTSADDAAHAIVADDAAGKILLAGTTNPGSSRDVALARLNIADGTPDTSFGVAANGRVVTDVPRAVQSSETARDVVQQPDGKLVVVGPTNVTNELNRADFDFGVARYNTDGTLDATFGAGGVDGSGKVSSNFSGGGGSTPGSADDARAVALQPDGKIVVAGFTGTDFAVARYTTDGVPDPDFGGGDGLVSQNIGGAQFDHAYDVVTSGAPGSADFRIVVAGVQQDNGFSDARFALAAYEEDGDSDSDFGIGGVTLTKVGPDTGPDATTDTARAIELLPDGKLLVAGDTFENNPSSAGDFALARYTALGVLDTTFSPGGPDGDGITLTDFTGGFESVRGLDARELGGVLRIVVTGRSLSNPQLAAYTGLGDLDPTFGLGGADGDGKVTLAVSGNNNSLNDVAIDEAGSIYVTGGIAEPPAIFGAAKLTPSGAMDTAFGGGDGVVNRNVVNGAGQGLLLQADGRLVVVGPETSASNGSDFLVDRYLTAADPVVVQPPVVQTPTPAPAPKAKKCKKGQKLKKGKCVKKKKPKKKK